MTSYAYKWFGGPNGLSSVHGGDHEWVVGEWVAVQTPVVPCSRGLHLCRREHLLQWCAPALWVAEYDGELVGDDEKIAVERARIVRRIETWTDASARLFAADCAERALRRERDAGREPDARSWAAVDAARAFTRGEITNKERVAAWVAAWDAAGDAAGAAAGAAARAAASGAERAWQLDHLFAAYLTDGAIDD